MTVHCNTGEFDLGNGKTVEGTVEGMADGKLNVRTADGLVQVSPDQIEKVSGRIKVMGFKIPYRIDAYSKLFASGSKTLSRLAATLFDGPLEHFGMSAETRARMLSGEIQAEGQHWISTHMHKALVEAKVPLKNRFAFENKFQEDVAAVARGDAKAIDEASVHVKNAAKAYSDAMRKAAEMLEEKGVVDKGVLTGRNNHVTRSWNGMKALHFERRFGKEALLDLLASSLRAKDVKLSISQSLEAANVIRKTVRSPDVEGFLNNAAVFGEKALNDAAAKVAQDNDIDEELAKSVISMMNGEAASFSVGTLKKRLNIDETLTKSVLDKQTGQHVEVSVSDLFNNNASQLLNGYTKKVSGIIVMAERGNLHKEAVFNAYIATAREEMVDAGKSANAIDERIEIMRELRKAVMGQLQPDSGNFARAARMLMNFSFIRFMGQAGFSQTAELSGIYGYAGFSAVHKHVPIVKKIVSDMTQGMPIDDQFAKDLMNMGVGMEQISSKFYLQGEDVYESGFFGGVERWLDNVKHGVSHMSGLRLANTTLAQLSGRSWFQFMWEAASGNAKHGSAILERLAADGMDSAKLARVEDGLRKFVQTKNGVVEHIDTDAWLRADPDSYAEMIATMHTQTRKMFIQSGVAERPFWMSKIAGQLLMQMRSYIVDTYTKSTLNHVKHHDSIALVTMLMGVTIGGLQYAVRTYVNNLNDKERRDEKLKIKELIVQGVNNASPFSVLPVVMDISLEASGKKPFFGNKLGGGEAKDFVGGSGALRTADDLVSTAFTGVKTVAGMGDYAPTKHEINRGVSLVVPNALGMRNLQNFLSQNAPDKAPEAEDLFAPN